MREGPEAGPFLCNLDLLIMLGGLLLGLPGLLALMPVGWLAPYRVYQEALQPTTGRNSRRGWP
jgi:hypothetical protein